MSLAPEHIEYFRRGEVENPKFWSRFGGMPDLHNKTVLDLGCGHGRMCIDLAAAGAARVVGIDLDAERVHFARAWAAEEYPGLADRVEFHHLSIDELPPAAQFDVMVSKDAFEHILDLPGVLAEARRRLVEGGRLYAGWGPLWRGPFGGHSLPRHVIGCRFPWAQLWIPDRVLVRASNRREGTDARTVRDLGLNQYSLADYERVLRESGLRLHSLRLNQSRNPLLRATRPLTRLPVLGEYLVHNAYAILEKPE